MKWFDIFKNYNLKQFRKNKASSILIAVSVMLAVCISLAIPQVVLSLEEFGENKSWKMNGADLKIEAPYESQEFLEKIETLKSRTDVKEIKVYNSTIENDGIQMYGQLLAGDYGLQADETIISRNIADTMKADIGSYVVISGKEYLVSGIEKRVRGVGEQAEMMGYAKVSSITTISDYFSSTLYYINDKNYDQIKSDLKKIEDSYHYTTVTDVRAQMGKQAQSEATSLNILNTLSIIMTVLSVMSSIYLIIYKSRQDIAVLKLIAIKEKDIGKAFKAQFLCLILPSVLIGAGTSVFAAKILLSGNHIDYSFGTKAGMAIAAGIVLFYTIYILYVNTACKLLRQINPLSILKTGEGIGKGGHIMVKGVCYTIFFLFIYSVYVGVDNLFSSSLMIMLFLTVFFAVLLFIIKIFTAVKFGKVMSRYFVAHIREKKNSFCLTIMSLSFTILFFLAGFTLGKTIADGFSQSINRKIDYNYMLTAKHPENIEDIIQQSEDTGFYTKLNLNYGLLYLNGVLKEQVVVDGIEADKYSVKYHVLEGCDIFEGSSGEVLISQEIADKYKLGISDIIEVRAESLEQAFKIKGIYESGGMNENHILIRNSELKNKNAGFMYLAKINSEELIAKLKKVQIVNLQNVSKALEEAIQNFMNVFKTLCIICIITSIVFNINIVYMNYNADYKNFIIMRAIGLGKKALYQNVFMEALIMLMLTLLMSTGIYIGFVNLAVKFMFEAQVTLNASMILIPVAIALLILTVIFGVPIRMIQKSAEFGELRELV